VVLARRDLGYYYNSAPFSTFRSGNVLFIVIKAPVTMRSLAMPFHLYGLVNLPLQAPQKHDFYCWLSTDIKAIAIARDADYIIQVTEGHLIPSGAVWQSRDPAVSFIDSTRSTCARALVDGSLKDIKVISFRCSHIVRNTKTK